MPIGKLARKAAAIAVFALGFTPVANALTVAALEGPAQLRRIYMLEAAYHGDNDTFSANLATIGFTPPSPAGYQYAVTFASPTSFTATAKSYVGAANRAYPNCATADVYRIDQTGTMTHTTDASLACTANPNAPLHQVFTLETTYYADFGNYSGSLQAIGFTPPNGAYSFAIESLGQAGFVARAISATGPAHPFYPGCLYADKYTIDQTNTLRHTQDASTFCASVPSLPMASLRALYTLELAYHGDMDTFGSFAQVGFTPPSQPLYTFQLDSSSPTAFRASATSGTGAANRAYPNCATADRYVIDQNNRLQHSPDASTACPSMPYTQLRQIYTLQTAYHGDWDTYASSLTDIGFVPPSPSPYMFRIDTATPTGFTASATTASGASHPIYPGCRTADKFTVDQTGTVRHVQDASVACN
jgi:hypothetical protein